MNQSCISHPTAPEDACLEPPPPSQPIISPSYELCPSFIAKVQEQSFVGGDENPYTHLRDFEKLCLCLHIQGMTRDTLKWKLFLFSLMGAAKHWYARYLESAHGEWESLQYKFCLAFFPISRVVCLRVEILTFKQKEKEPLGTTWAHFIDLASFGPDLAITDPMLLQHFYLGLSKDSA